MKLITYNNYSFFFIEKQTMNFPNFNWDRFTDDVIEASDGNIYFTIPSTKFGMHNWYLDVLEARPHGQLLRYNPMSNETVVVLDDLAFANGVALSKDEDYLLVCETWK